MARQESIHNFMFLGHLLRLFYSELPHFLCRLSNICCAPVNPFTKSIELRCAFFRIALAHILRNQNILPSLVVRAFRFILFRVVV